MTARRKTPTFSQLRRLAEEKLGNGCSCVVKRSEMRADRWIATAGAIAGKQEVAPIIDVWTSSRAAAVRVLCAALEAL